MTTEPVPADVEFRIVSEALAWAFLTIVDEAAAENGRCQHVADLLIPSDHA